MRLAAGTVASLVLTIGALLLVVAVDYSSKTVLNGGRRPPKSAFLRSSKRRRLYNYSNNDDGNNANNNDDGNNAYGGDYGYAENNQENSYEGSYGNNDDGNYQDNGGYSNGDDAAYYDGDYGNSNSAYSNDDNTYYNSNSAYQANVYNGRDQYWDGQSVQMYTDDEEPVIEEEGEGGIKVFGKYAGLSIASTFSLVFLLLMAAISTYVFLLLARGFNLIDFYHKYLCKRRPANEPKDDSFVKLEDPVLS